MRAVGEGDNSPMTSSILPGTCSSSATMPMRGRGRGAGGGMVVGGG